MALQSYDHLQLGTQKKFAKTHLSRMRPRSK